MNDFFIYRTWTIYCSFIIAILLQFILCFLIKWYLQPSWVMMLLIYWIILLPKRISIGTGFTLGLIIDIISCSTLGVHSLSLSILSYITIKKVYFFRNMSVIQQSIFITLYSLTNHSIKFLIKFLVAKIIYSPEIFWHCIIDGITWPVLIIVMHKYTHTK